MRNLDTRPTFTRSAFRLDRLGRKAAHHVIGIEVLPGGLAAFAHFFERPSIAFGGGADTPLNCLAASWRHPSGQKRVDDLNQLLRSTSPRIISRHLGIDHVLADVI